MSARLAIALLLMGGCAPRRPVDDERADCPRIYVGATQSIDLPMAEAVGRLGERSGLLSCTIAQLAPGRAITAAHCFASEFEMPMVGFDDCRESPVLDIEFHPEVDVALVEYESIEMVPSLRPFTKEVRVGRSVVLGGFGESEEGFLEQRHFVETTVVERDNGHLVVESELEVGACRGDSGGPLLVPDAGQFLLGGILTFGDASCTGQDTYVEIRHLQEWLDDRLAV